MLKKLLPVFATLALTACANMTFKGMYEMATFDLYELDPNQLRIAVRTDKELEIKQGNVVIDMSFISDDETLYVDEKFLPEVSQQRAISGELADGIKANEQVTIFNLTQADAKTMVDTLAQAKEYKESGRKGTGSFGIRIDNICFEKDYLANSEIDILIQKSVDDDYFVFLENLNLQKLADKHENTETLDKLNCSQEAS